jgi:hypothetical protein
MLFQFVLSVAIIASMWLVSRRHRQQAVSGIVALLWSVGAIGALVITWYPDTASFLANIVGVGRGADLIVYLAVVLLFVLVFQLHVSHVRLERQLTKLVREHSLSELDSRLRGNDTV